MKHIVCFFIGRIQRHTYIRAPLPCFDCIANIDKLMTTECLCDVSEVATSKAR